MNITKFIKENFVFLFLSILSLTALILFILAPDVFMIAFAGILFAIFLHALSKFFDTFIPGGYKISLFTTLFVLLICVVLFFWYLLPALQDQISGFQDIQPEITSSLNDLSSSYPWTQPFISSVQNINFESFVWSNQANIINSITGIFSSTFNFLVSFIIIIFIGIYVALTPSQYRDGIISLFPPRHRKRAEKITIRLGTVLQRWLIGRILSMIIIALFTWLGLFILNVPLALPLAILAGLFSFIPNIGPILSVLPAVFVGLSQGLTVAFYIVVLFIIIQIIESYFLSPFIQQKSIKLPPALLLLSLILMGILFGIMGLLLAAPIVAVIMTLIQEIYIKEIEQ